MRYKNIGFLRHT